MPGFIPHSRPTVGEAEALAAADAVRSGQLSEGPRVAAFERGMAAFLGRREGAAVSSGLAALHLALNALGVGPGDGVVVPSYNCAALVHAVRHCGAEVRLCDVDPLTGNPTPESVGAAAEGARAVIVTHLFGAPAEAADIAALGPPRWRTSPKGSEREERREAREASGGWPYAASTPQNFLPPERAAWSWATSRASSAGSATAAPTMSAAT